MLLKKLLIVISLYKYYCMYYLVSLIIGLLDGLLLKTGIYSIVFRLTVLIYKFHTNYLQPIKLIGSTFEFIFTILLGSYQNGLFFGMGGKPKYIHKLYKNYNYGNIHTFTRLISSYDDVKEKINEWTDKSDYGIAIASRRRFGFGLPRSLAIFKNLNNQKRLEVLKWIHQNTSINNIPKITPYVKPDNEWIIYNTWHCITNVYLQNKLKDSMKMSQFIDESIPIIKIYLKILFPLDTPTIETHLLSLGSIHFIGKYYKKKLVTLIKKYFNLDKNIELYDIVNGFLFAGMGGTTTLIENTIKNIKKYPKKITDSNIGEFILETSRLDPPVPGSIVIHKNHAYTLSIINALMDSSQFIDPEKFDPNREQFKNPGPSQTILWNGISGSSRHCPGSQISFNIACDIVKEYIKK